MTIPLEEKAAIKRTRKFLSDILSLNLTEIRKNPANIREQACRCIRHFPPDYRVERLYKDAE